MKSKKRFRAFVRKRTNGGRLKERAVKTFLRVEQVNFMFYKQADCGTHVRNLNEVGQIRLVKTRNKGKFNRRVYFTLV